MRLHADGTLDASFNPAPDGTVWCLALQPDGKILAGGNFQHIAGSPASGLARLHADGTFDTAFSAIAGEVRSIALQPDGRILAGEITAGKVMRFFPDGQPDPSLTLSGTLPSEIAGIFDLTLQANGQCAVAGRFTTFGGAPRATIARINASGTLDSDFAPRAGTLTFGYNRRLALQANGKVLAFGGFDSTERFPVAAPNAEFMRLDNDQTTSQLSTPGGTAVRWLRSGATPEVRDVTFDVKPSGTADWSRLGTASRIPGGWELSGLTLPSSGEIRAQAYAGGSVMEQTAPVLTPLASWRLQHFNTPDNTGPAADDADPDHDGLTNFTEFAFGLNPVDRTSNTLPEFKSANSSFTAAFTAPEGRDDVIYSAEWSTSLLPGTWTLIPYSGAAGRHMFSAPGGAGRVFVRFVVTMR